MIDCQQPRQLSLIQKSEAIKSIEKASEDTPIIIDFDETLFLRNSTAEYLDSLRPRLMGLLLLKALYFAQPWLWLPQPFRSIRNRDWFLVFFSTVLMPWTLIVWHHKAKILAKKYGNKELIAAINRNKKSSIIIATLGFNFIINPLINNLKIRWHETIACRFWQGATDRQKGKLLMVQEVLPPTAIEKAVVITDSYDDMPLLQAVAMPCLVIWPLARYVPPLQDVYLPFFYLEKVKRVGENYTSKVILWDDLPILLLAFSWQANHPLIHGISILFLLISFWCVYEIGYYENDWVAEKYEEKPKLSITYHSYKHMMDSNYPWIWSAVFGFLGVILLVNSQDINLLFDLGARASNFEAVNPVLLPLIYWISFLLVSRVCFWVYNYLNKHTRTWLYLLLQSFRYYGFAVVTATNLIGTSLLSSHILSRSILYVVYRHSGGNADSWPKEVPEKLLRWLIFLFILGAIAIGSRDFTLWENWQTWTIIAWCLVQGKGQIIRVLRRVRPVFKDGSNRVTSIS
ncbi:MAG: hypothetical protein Tsb0014_28040 [Pleurocapsa sp.]